MVAEWERQVPLSLNRAKLSNDYSGANEKLTDLYFKMSNLQKSMDE